MFVDRARSRPDQAGGFFEWAEFLGNLYGTPVADPGTVVTCSSRSISRGPGRSRPRPEAILILLRAPSPEVQEARLRARGDGEAHIAGAAADRRRGGQEGLAIADEVVVNR